MTLSNTQQEIIDNVCTTQKINFLIHGRAGTGKSVLLRELCNRLKCNGHNLAVLGPTGMSVSGLENGETIASFIGATKSSLGVPSRLVNTVANSNYVTIDYIIIDECGMISAAEFTSLDTIMRRAHNTDTPFGNASLILIGDVFQLPPVDNFFFTTSSWHNIEKQGLIKVYQLHQIFRHSDDADADDRNEMELFLESLRTGQFTSNSYAQGIVDYRLISKHIPPEKKLSTIVMCATNEAAAEINTNRLALLSTREYCFKKTKKTPKEKSFVVKIGARVQLTQNMYSKDGQHTLVAHNGLLGSVVAIEPVSDTNPELPDSGIILSASNVWKITIRRDDTGDELSVESGKEEQTGQDNHIKEITKSAYSFSLRIAYAVTIHRLQGQTLSSGIICGKQLFGGRAHIYTAFSRFKSLGRGLYISNLNSYKISKILTQSTDSEEFVRFIQHYKLK